MGINTLLVRRPLSELQPGKAARNLIAAFEGLSLVAYPDPASGGDPWTIGYGHTGPEVVPGLTITLKQADELLEADMLEAWETVKANVNVALTQGEADALTSIAFNLGYVPKSMKAALNGGVTDKGERLEPGSYGSALKQFPRNCRAGGIPMRGLLRRRLAEACVFCGLPWEAACSLNIVRLKLDANNNPDPYETTSLEETLERARQDTSKPPDTSSILKAPWPAPKPAPTVTIITDTPAPQPAPNPPVKPEAKSPPVKAGGEEGAALDPTAPQPTSPPPRITVPASPPPPVKTVEAPKPPVVVRDPPEPPRPPPPSVAVNPSNADMGPGLRNMFRSKRFYGGLLIVVGRVVIALDVSGNFSEPVRALIGDGIIMDWTTGLLVNLVGELVLDRGEKKARAPMGTPKEIALYTQPPVRS